MPDATPNATASQSRWTKDQARALYDKPFFDLVGLAHQQHLQVFPANQVQMSKLLNIKTGGCPEDCGYCSQSTSAEAGLKASKLMSPAQVIEEAQKAKDAGATRYCMGAAWRSPKARDEPAIVEMIEGVKALGLETCMTLGMLSEDQAKTFQAAGLDYYNHNIDTSERFYPEVITTRRFQERIDTLEVVRASGMKVCSGGILGLGESADDRIDMLLALANLPTPPESVPINMLIPIKGTRLGEANNAVDPFDFIRIIALARLLMPHAHVRLTAGRATMSDEMQAWCFFAGANSLFMGDKLLTADNPGDDRDASLLARINLTPAP